jgi:hypothetical protein
MNRAAFLNWKTTSVAFLILITWILKLFAINIPDDVAGAITAILTFFGLLFAADAMNGAKKLVAFFLTIGLIFSLAACGSWQKTTVISYDVASMTLRTTKDTAVIMCDTGKLNLPVCTQLKSVYAQARVSFILAGDILAMAIKTDDALKAKELQAEYALKIADFKKLGNRFFDAAYTLKVTETKYLIK